MKFYEIVFKTANDDVIQDCCNFLKFSLPSYLLAVRYATFCNHWYFGLK